MRSCFCLAARTRALSRYSSPVLRSAWRVAVALLLGNAACSRRETAAAVPVIAGIPQQSAAAQNGGPPDGDHELKWTTRDIPKLAELRQAVRSGSRVWVLADRLWAPEATGLVVSFEKGRPSFRVQLEGAILDLRRLGDDVMALRRDGSTVEVLKMNGARPQSLGCAQVEENSRPLGVISVGENLAVLGTASIVYIERGSCVARATVPLTPALKIRKASRVVVTPVSNGRVVYVGTSLGEWSEGLWVVDTLNGVVASLATCATVRRCSEPIPASADIRGSAADTQAACAIVAIGNTHWFPRGRLARACPWGTEEVWKKELAPWRDSSTMPLYGVAAGNSPQAYTVLTHDSLLVLKDGRVDHEVPLRPPPLAGLHELEVEGLTVLVRAVGQDQGKPDALLVQ